MSRPNGQGIAPADLDRIATLVEARFGIRADAADLRSAVAERLVVTGAASASTYVERLDSHQSAKEWSAMGNHLTVPETYFFRNACHWEAFAEYAIPRILAKQRAHSPPLRIWSAGCSTGEEPYTIAMALAEMGLSKLVGTGGIVATDLLEKSLATAKQAAYRSNSFRGVSKERIDRWFHRDGEVLTVGSEIRAAVTFQQLNLADAPAVAAFIAREGPFHVVFCRNVLIYFAPKVCSRLLDELATSLAPEGTLFLGHSEFPHLWTDALESVPVSDTFVWRRCPVGKRREPVEKRSEISKGYQAPKSLVPLCPSTPGDRPEPTLDAQTTGETEGSGRLAPAVGGPPGVGEPCVKAQDIATPGESHDKDGQDWWHRVAGVLEHLKEGRRDEAFALAQQLVAANDLLPETHYVLGLVLKEAGDMTGAINCYGRSTFLDNTFAHAHWRLSVALGTWKLGNRAVAEARWAVRTVTEESDERVSHLSDVGRPALTRMMEQTLECLLEQRQRKTACAVS